MATPTPVFPAAVATDAQLKVANNLITTALKVAAGVSDTILFVNSTTGFLPNCLVSIDKEILAITSVTSSPNATLTVASGGRGFDGTTAAQHSGGAKVSMLIDAWHHNALAAEIKAIESALGPNLANAAGGGLYLISRSFDFPPQTPGGTLIAGTNSITLSPVPVGVNGTDQKHYLYISGGTGAAEAVLITGGSAVSGAPSGTLIFTCANAHAGAWTIKSATAGIQEAVNSVSGTTQNVCIAVPPGDNFVYATVQLPAANATGHFGNLSLVGLGLSVTQIRRGAAFTNGDLFLIDGTTSHGAVTIRDMDIINDASGSKVTAGAAIHILNQQTQTALVENVKIQDGYIGLWIDTCDFIHVANVDVFFTTTYTALAGTRPLAGFLVTGASGNAAVITNSNSWTFDRTAGNVQYGMLIRGVDGLQVTNCGFCGATGVKLEPATVSVTNVYMNNLIVDSCTLKGIDFGAIGAGQIAGNVAMSNLQIVSYAKSGGGFAANQVGIDFEDAVGWNLVVVANFNISGWQFAGIRFLTHAQSAGPMVFSSGTITEIGLPAAHGFGVSFQAGVCGITMTGIRIGDVLTGTQCMDYNFAGDSANNAQYFDWVITGCNVRQHAGPSWLFLGPGASGFLLDSRIANNVGVDTVMPSVASAAALAMPNYPNFSFTGTTGVTSITTGMPPGFAWNFIPAGAVVFTAGATIGNTFTCTPGLPVLGFWDGNKLWLK